MTKAKKICGHPEWWDLHEGKDEECIHPDHDSEHSVPVPWWGALVDEQGRDRRTGQPAWTPEP